MSFLHLPLLAAGSICVLAPLILHLAMRRKPQHAIFPPLRFVQRRQVVNQRRLRLRHWALLALRCAGVLIAAAALARPIVASSAVGGWLLAGLAASAALVTGGLCLASATRQRGSSLVWGFGLATIASLAVLVIAVGRNLAGSPQVPTVGNEAPVQAIMLFDTSPRMQYISSGKTRLQVAQEWANALLRELPPDSQVAVMDTNLGGSAFAIDIAAARSEVEGLRIAYTPQPLPRLIESAWRMFEAASGDAQQELYIFTDLTQQSWPSSDDRRLAEDFAAETAPYLYVLDVGAAEPKNLALGPVVLSREQLGQNGSLTLQFDVQSLGMAGTRRVGVYLESPDPDLPMIVDGEVRLPPERLRGQRELSLDLDQLQTVELNIGGLELGTLHGRVHLAGDDGLAVDDTRYFSVRVHPPWRILIVAGPGADPRYLVEAVSPYAFRARGQALFACEEMPWEELTETDLQPFDAVTLLDPPPLPPAAWQKLYDFVERGKGLGLFLGRNANIGDWNEPLVQQLAPATIERIWRAGPDSIYWTLSSDPHPILNVLRPLQSSVPWAEFPVMRHWQVGQLSPGGLVVMRFGNGQPAILERGIGLGRVLMTTTPLSDPSYERGRTPWNRGLDSWPFVVLVNEMHKYLVQGNQSQLNFVVGQTVRIPKSADDPNEYQLFTPEGTWQNITAVNRVFSIVSTREPGNYRLKPMDPSGFPQGFSLNVPPEQTNLRRIDQARLDQILGQDQYQLASDFSSLHRQVGEARRGHEFYAWGILAFAVLLGLEHVLSNRFYASTGT